MPKLDAASLLSDPAPLWLDTASLPESLDADDLLDSADDHHLSATQPGQFSGPQGESFTDDLALGRHVGLAPSPGRPVLAVVSPAPDDPLAQALPWLVRHLGVAAAVEAVVGPVDGDHAASSDDVLPALRRIGFDAHIERRAIRSFGAVDLPAVLLLHSGDACVLTMRWMGAGGQAMCSVVLPGAQPGEITAPEAEIEAEYTGVALVVSPPKPPFASALSRARSAASSAQRSGLASGSLASVAQAVIDAQAAAAAKNPAGWVMGNADHTPVGWDPQQPPLPAQAGPSARAGAGQGAERRSEAAPRVQQHIPPHTHPHTHPHAHQHAHQHTQQPTRQNAPLEASAPAMAQAGDDPAVVLNLSFMQPSAPSSVSGQVFRQEVADAAGLVWRLALAALRGGRSALRSQGIHRVWQLMCGLKATARWVAQAGGRIHGLGRHVSPGLAGLARHLRPLWRQGVAGVHGLADLAGMLGARLAARVTPRPNPCYASFATDPRLESRQEPGDPAQIKPQPEPGLAAPARQLAADERWAERRAAAPAPAAVQAAISAAISAATPAPTDARIAVQTRLAPSLSEARPAWVMDDELQALPVTASATPATPATPTTSARRRVERSRVQAAPTALTLKSAAQSLWSGAASGRLAQWSGLGVWSALCLLVGAPQAWAGMVSASSGQAVRAAPGLLRGAFVADQQRAIEALLAQAQDQLDEAVEAMVCQASQIQALSAGVASLLPAAAAVRLHEPQPTPAHTTGLARSLGGDARGVSGALFLQRAVGNADGHARAARGRGLPRRARHTCR